MIQIKVKDGVVTNVLYSNSELIDGWIEVSSFPEPEEREGMYAVPHYGNGEILYEYLPLPSAPEPPEPPVAEQ